MDPETLVLSPDNGRAFSSIIGNEDFDWDNDEILLGVTDAEVVIHDIKTWVRCQILILCFIVQIIDYSLHMIIN